MFTRLETCFTVFPQHTNSLSPLIFGGAFFAEMDKAAAIAVRRLLYSSPTKCTNAVTHRADVVFNKPCYQGDLIFLNAEIVKVGHNKSIVVNVKATRETFVDGPRRELIADINFVFVSILDESKVKDKPDMLPYYAHGITKEDIEAGKEADEDNVWM